MTAVVLTRSAPYNRPLSGTSYNAEILRGYRGRDATSVLYRDNLWIQAQQVPLFQIDFTTGSIRSIVGTNPTPTFTRPGSIKTLRTANGFTDFAADVPAFGPDPATGQFGYCHEPSAQNLFLNNNAPVTQAITVTAVQHTLSFYGTGTITLSGVATGTLVGTGSGRVSLAFTPTAGVLTVTCTGETILPQVEIGAVPTSPIRTAGSPVTRAADTLTLGGADFTAIWNALGGVLYTETSGASSAVQGLLGADDGTALERIRIGRAAATTGATAVVDNNVLQSALNSGSGFPVNAVSKAAARFLLNNFALSTGGVAEVTTATGTIPTPTQFTIGNANSVASFQGFMFKVAYFAPGGSAQARLQQMTA